jgi:prepilin-type processing-associated H-X9-DG protein
VRMCDDHSGVLMEIPTASKRGPDGNKRGIDACIAPLVKVLNDGGYATVASCCGHSGWGNIALADGRELLIAPDYESARLVELGLPAGSPREDR